MVILMLINSRDFVTFVAFLFFVIAAPFVDYSRTRSRVLSWPGNPVNMTCVINGYPAPSIKWYNYQNYRLNATEGYVEFLPGQPAGTSTVLVSFQSVESRH